MTDIFSKIIPILLLIAIGWGLRYKEIFHQRTVDEIKKLVINFSLSAVLFLAFINMELKAEYFLVFIIIFIFLNCLYCSGLLLNKIKAIYHPLTPFMISGFTFGLLGIPLFTTVFGIENVGKLSVIGVGHEFFVWLVMYTLMRVRFKNEKFSIGVLTEIIKSPMIISIALGITFNMIGLNGWIHKNPLAGGIFITIEYLASLATPLILIIIGYGLKFNKKYMEQSIKFVIIRIVSGLTLGYLFKYFIINPVMTPDIIFDYAYFTFLILPPPLSLPIFVGTYSNIKEYEELTNNTVVLSTVVSITIYFLFLLTI